MNVVEVSGFTTVTTSTSLIDIGGKDMTLFRQVNTLADDIVTPVLYLRDPCPLLSPC